MKLTEEQRIEYQKSAKHIVLMMLIETRDTLRDVGKMTDESSPEAMTKLVEGMFERFHMVAEREVEKMPIEYLRYNLVGTIVGDVSRSLQSKLLMMSMNGVDPSMVLDIMIDAFTKHP